MPGRASRSSRYATNIWPGFVDALATLLMVIIFLLMIFVLAQFFLSEALTGRDEALKRLQGQVSELSDLLALERQTNAELSAEVSSLSEELQASLRKRDNLESTVSSLKGRLSQAESRAENLKGQLAQAFDTITADKEKIRNQLSRLADLSQEVEALTALRDELEKEVSRLSVQLQTAKKEKKKTEEEKEKTEEELKETRVALAEQEKISESAKAQLALLNKQTRALREQMAALQDALDAAERKAAQQKVRIQSLGKRLNAALASKVQQLKKYRSEFFGRLREILGDKKDIRIVGDRFVFQSEVLFASAKAELGDQGKQQLEQLAGTLKEVAAEIPDDVDWVLRVDGHTDDVPINTWRFGSNWELSAARAVNVVKFLIDQGIPAERLVAAGFGEFHPIAEGDTETARRKNRRIEFKLTQR